MQTIVFETAPFYFHPQDTTLFRMNRELHCALKDTNDVMIHIDSLSVLCYTKLRKAVL